MRLPLDGAGGEAVRIALALRDAGHQAYLVGGCVRDLLLGREPLDYDIATSARPGAVEALFPGSGLAGAHFGVVLVPGAAQAVQVATFRGENGYSDGRRPDRVSFEAGPEQDAARRDFTINALFLDPATEQVLDFTGGRTDLENRVVRAIGHPAARFQEDRLRLLRAARFAAQLGFTIEPATFAAMAAMASGVQTVARERVREELLKLLTAAQPDAGVACLELSGLMREILPEATAGAAGRAARLTGGSKALMLAGLLFGSPHPDQALARLALPRILEERTRAILDGAARLPGAPAMAVSELKRFLRQPAISEVLALARAAGGEEAASFAAGRLEAWPPAALWPDPLLGGRDLAALGVPQGRLYSRILTAVEDGQLAGTVRTREEALELVRALWS